MRKVDTAQVEGVVSKSFENAAKSSQQPRKSGNSKKQPSPISLRLTEAEKSVLRELAAGMSISAYIRECVFGQRAAKRVVPAADRVILGQILARLGESRMANNLNQIAYHANCGSLRMDGTTEEEIKTACASIAWMRVTLIEALGLKGRRGS